MSLLVRALVGLSTSFLCAVAVAQPFKLTIVLPDSVAHPVASLSELQDETARVFSGAGYTFQWIEKHAALGRSFEQLIVVRFAGACTSRGNDAMSSRSTQSLATTAVSDGEVLPFVQIDCDQTRRLISPALNPLPEGARAAVYARALGRVLAHELYHVLARTQTHAGSGVAKSCFGMNDLIARRFHFDKASVAQIRTAQARAAQLAVVDPSGSPQPAANGADAAYAAEESPQR